MRCNFVGCKTKITLAQSISTSLCVCNQLFCVLHKNLHASTCSKVETSLENAKIEFYKKLQNGKTVAFNLTRI